jgi:hypothetical protein
VENGKLRKRKYSLEEISLWDKDGGYLFRSGLTEYQRLLRGVYLTIAYPDSLTAIYQRQRLRRFPWMIKDYAKALSYYYKSHIKFGCPSIKENEARLIVEKAKLDDNRFREKQRIIAAIKRMNVKNTI